LYTPWSGARTDYVSRVEITAKKLDTAKKLVDYIEKQGHITPTNHLKSTTTNMRGHNFIPVLILTSAILTYNLNAMDVDVQNVGEWTPSRTEQRGRQLIKA
jgi:hypothetical protein